MGPDHPDGRPRGLLLLLRPPLPGAIQSPCRGPMTRTGSPRQEAAYHDLGPVAFGTPPDVSPGVETSPDLGASWSHAAKGAILDGDCIMVGSRAGSLCRDRLDGPTPVELLLRPGRASARDEDAKQSDASQKSVHEVVLGSTRIPMVATAGHQAGWLPPRHSVGVRPDQRRKARVKALASE